MMKQLTVFEDVIKIERNSNVKILIESFLKVVSTR